MKVGLAWYEERDYAAILTITEDADRLPSTFSSWLEKAEKTERALKRQGHTVVRAMILSGEFPAWCQSRGMKVDADARKLFANYVAAGKL
jgi:hypothetical protein